MIPRKALLAHIFFALCLRLSSLDSTSADMLCKNQVMSIVTTQCSGFGRIKRAPAQVETDSEGVRSSGGRYPALRILPAGGPGQFPAFREYYAEAPPPPGPRLFQPDSSFSRLLPQATGDDLGFNLTPDEVDELYDALSNRILRRSQKSQEEMKKDILRAAAKCCQNVDRCLKQQSIIECV